MGLRFSGFDTTGWPVTSVLGCVQQSCDFFLVYIVFSIRVKAILFPAFYSHREIEFLMYLNLAILYSFSIVCFPTFWTFLQTLSLFFHTSQALVFMQVFSWGLGRKACLFNNGHTYYYPKEVIFRRKRRAVMQKWIFVLTVWFCGLSRSSYSLNQVFSNIGMHQNYLEDLLKHFCHLKFLNNIIILIPLYSPPPINHIPIKPDTHYHSQNQDQ